MHEFIFCTFEYIFGLECQSGYSYKSRVATDSFLWYFKTNNIDSFFIYSFIQRKQFNVKHFCRTYSTNFCYFQDDMLLQALYHKSTIVFLFINKSINKLSYLYRVVLFNFWTLCSMNILCRCTILLISFLCFLYYKRNYEIIRIMPPGL